MKVQSDLIDRSKKDISDLYDMIFKFQTQNLNAPMILLLSNEDSSMLTSINSLALSLLYNTYHHGPFKMVAQVLL